ncbi:rhomboid family intramembrane serine protease [Saprospiraceae bacterium]|nr:rhomboid family intramembrane serine protease [Saprospiraceae bacterium]
MGRITDAVKNLLIINVIVFFGTQALPEGIKSMGNMYFPLSENFQPYQILTNMFMHADFQHLLFNMMTLFFLGPLVEQALGTKRFLQLYFLSGLGAVVLHMGIKWFEYQGIIAGLGPSEISAVANEGLSILNSGRNYRGELGELNYILNGSILGASGAVYGVLIAFATLFPNMKLMLLFPPIPIKAKYLAAGLIALGLFSGVTGFQQGVAHWGHLGGAIIGFIMIRFIWKLQSLR